MSLDHVSSGDPHVPAHNAERDAINALEESLASKLDLPASPGLGATMRWNGDDWVGSAMRLFEGNGAPEGVVSAPPGSRYVDATAASGVAEWFKQSGTGNTGWSPVNSGIGWAPVTMAANFAHTAGNAAQACMVNGVIYFRGQFRRTAGTTTLVGTLPTGTFPLKTIGSMIRAGANMIPFDIQANGSLVISSSIPSFTDLYMESVTGAPYRNV